MNILNFVGNSTVIGNVGATNPVNILNVQGNNAGTINLVAGGNLAAVTSSGGVNGIVNVLGVGTRNAAVGAGQLTTNTTGNVTVGTGTYTVPVMQLLAGPELLTQQLLQDRLILKGLQVRLTLMIPVL
ncbi:hypothetical protein [Rickettsia peacockii]|uniref:hypothetical protein n=1 Tax=Rickettsia peacockii TaxID=47589 RepID=UPI000313202F|nr:hypothetical protein [Rickettsia peacockii]